MADRALLRCIGRVYKDQRYTGYGCLVYQKLSELSKAPGMVITSLSLRNRCPVPDSLKIFKGYQGTGVFGLRDHVLGDTMVSVLGKPSHPAREVLQMSLGALGSTVLEPGLERIRSLPGILDLLAGVDLSIAIYSDVLDTKVSPDNIYRNVGRLFRRFYYNAEVEDVLDQDEISLASDSVHPGFLVVSCHGRYDLSTFQGGQRNVLRSFPGHNSLIVDYSAIKPKLWFDGFISLVSFSNLGDGPDCKLRRKAILSPNVVIRSIVDVIPIGTMHLENNFSYGITSLVESMHGIQEKLVLLFDGLKLDHQGLKHCIKYVAQYSYNLRTPLLPGLKTGVSGAEV
jgi:hypothetical protein